MNENKLHIIYQDKNLLVVKKPAGIIVFSDKRADEDTLINILIREFPFLEKVGKFPRYGIIHRLDRETSGILLVAKNEKALKFFQEQFAERKVLKKYTALVWGRLKEDKGEIKTLIGRSPKNRLKQKVFFPFEPSSQSKRMAVTEYRVLNRLSQIAAGRKNYYTLVEVNIKTGRRHQIRIHFSYLKHPIAGDKLYSFKDQIAPKGLARQFLHAAFLEISLPDNGKKKSFFSPLPEDLSEVLKNLNEDY